VISLSELHELTAGVTGVVDVACPLCGPACRSPANRKRKVLRIWDDGEFVTYKCARCDTAGWAKEQGAQRSVPRPRSVVEAKDDSDRRELAQFLWSRSGESTGSLAETYLRSRRCLVPSPALRFLPARGEHPPAMIARFGSGPITGIHLTKLAADGTGKAGTDKDKIMIGPSTGQPIVVADHPEHDALLVAEGIEDAASLAIATGWSAWAAGSAGRIASVVAAAGHFERVFVAVDADRAGRMALERCRTVRSDVIPLRFDRTLPGAPDANRALIAYGPDALLASIEWCEAQARYSRSEIGFHAMQAAIARSAGVFASLPKEGDA